MKPSPKVIDNVRRTLQDMASSVRGIDISTDMLERKIDHSDMVAWSKSKTNLYHASVMLEYVGNFIYTIDEEISTMAEAGDDTGIEDTLIEAIDILRFNMMELVRDIRNS
jgi:predicted TPR repeat methyltransferase